MHLAVWIFLRWVLFVQSGSACSSPFITQATGIATDAIQLTWLDPGSNEETVYDLEFVAGGAAPTGLPTYGAIADLSFTAMGLEAGTEYGIYIRAICPDGMSPWNGPVRAYTYIDNDASCRLSLPVPDNNCPQFRAYFIAVDGYGDALLGTDVFLMGVEMIVEHPWLADLTITLRNPAGLVVTLIADRGVGVRHLGVPGDSLCISVVTFTDVACTDLTGLHDMFTGPVRPEAPLISLHDHSTADGVWRIALCDKAADDVGTLRYVRLLLSESTCDAPPVLFVVQSLDTEAQISGLDDEICDHILIALWDVQSPEDTVYYQFDCGAASVTIDDLSPGHVYGFTAARICDSDTSLWSCPEVFSTTCAILSLLSSFDDLPVCIPACGVPCLIQDEVWESDSNSDQDWIIYEGGTPTDFTGPGGARFAQGRYLYVETSGVPCQDSITAVLTSRCLEVQSNGDGCDMSLWYHMYGATTGTLALEVSTDGGFEWATLWSLTGDQGNLWHQQSIDLTSWENMRIMLRFRAQSAPGSLGDIAIDDIGFFGTTLVDSAMIKWYYDADGDGYGTPDSVLCLCTTEPPPGFSMYDTDCDDTNPDVSPGADEIPCNLIDDNCDGVIDENNPDTITYTIMAFGDATCTGIDDGRIELAADGGTPPYTYLWSHGREGASVDSLRPGIYRATITDANGCGAFTAYFEIKAETTLEYFITGVTHPSCPGAADGAISGLAQGGTPPYHFTWSTGDTAQHIAGLADGTYRVTVSDTVGCMLVSQHIVLAATPTFQVPLLQRRHVSCHGASDGMLSIGINGGAVPPVTYQWNHGDTTAMPAILAAGTYMCTVTDAAGCIVVAGPFIIQQPPPLSVVVVSAESPRCHGGTDGSIQLNTSGGTPPYFFTWDHGPFTDDIFHLTEGTYRVTLRDLHGCDTMLTITLESPDALIAEIEEIRHVACPGDSTGRIIVAATGGTPPYRYDWSTGATSSPILGNLSAGVYSVTVSDAFGCKRPVRNIAVESTNEPLEVVFNSAGPVACHGDSTGYLYAAVTGGTPPYWFNWSAGVENMSLTGADSLAGLAAGNYRVTVTDVNGCTGISPLHMLAQPARLNYFLDSVVHNLCFGSDDGQIAITVQGGMPPYQYAWSHGTSDPDASGLAPGTYQVTITDALGCQLVSGTYTILEADPVALHFESHPTTGNNEDGWAMVHVSGGTPPYEYLWDPSAMSQTAALATGLAFGTYFVTVFDAAGCAYHGFVFVEMGTSTEDISTTGLFIYPNPARESVFLRGTIHSMPRYIYDVHGRAYPVTVQRHAGSLAEIRLGNIPAGVYFIPVDGLLLRIVIM